MNSQHPHLLPVILLRLDYYCSITAVSLTLRRKKLYDIYHIVEAILLWYSFYASSCSRDVAGLSESVA